MRRPIAVLAATVALLAGGAAAAPAAHAAAAPQVLVDELDPLLTDPLGLDVTVLDGSGSAAAFSGTATLSVGTARTAGPVAAAAGAEGEVELATTTLPAGWATLTLRLHVGGSLVVRSYPWFTEITPQLSVSAFGCSAVTAGGGAIQWAVDVLDGEPVRTPNSREVPLLPYVRTFGRRWVMTDEHGAALATSGAVVIRSGTKPVARIPLPSRVRRLVFGTTWNGRAAGVFRPGLYTAVLTLTDATGTVVTASQAVQVVRSGTGTCGL